MRLSKMIGYIVGCAGVLAVGAALAKEPERTAERGLATPAGCVDSMRGRTHILRFCGGEHYWIKRPASASLPVAGGLYSASGQPVSFGTDVVSSAGLNGAGR